MQGQFRYVAKISLGSENFASLAKLHRDSEITKFRYALPISLAWRNVLEIAKMYNFSRHSD